ncbi:MAG: hypothetical protein V1874_13945 [Spirochaetota bacterium]
MHNFYNLWKTVKYLAFEIIRFLGRMLASLAEKIRQKFLDASISEKIIYLNIIPAFFAIILPVARFHIFGNNFEVNNPLAIHLIVIIIIMFASSYLHELKRLLVRSLLNAYYLFWVLFIYFTGTLTKARPYEISFGFYLNIAVPVIFISAALLAYFVYKE